MCLQASVGRLAINRAEDVKVVQVLLNMAVTGTVPTRFVPESGRIDAVTVAAIESFQSQSAIEQEQDGPVYAASRTLRGLHDVMPAGFCPAKLQGIMIHAGPELIAKYFFHIEAITHRYGISTPLRLAHFLAQTGHESGELRWTSEFASGAAYEGRAGLGNTQLGDGKRFRGRGLIQITGRANYTAYSKARGIDFTTDAGALWLSIDPATAVDASCWFWKKKGLNELADRDDFMGITRRVNGATHGLNERGEILARARFFLL